MHLRNGGLMPDGNYQYYGQMLLDGLRQFDPAASWTFEPSYSNEGGETPGGWRLNYDVTKLPNIEGPGMGNRYDHAGLVPADIGYDLTRPDMVYDDPYYGRLTPQQNEKQDKPAWWEIAAPLAIGLVAPWAAGLAASAGIGVAGLSSAVTSGAYGGLAGGAVGAGGAGAAGAGGGDWWSRILAKAPSTARAINNAVSPPTRTPRPTRPVAAPTPTAAGYNPGAFNNAGSVPKASSNESSLVATQFADDPYRFSG